MPDRGLVADTDVTLMICAGHDVLAGLRDDAVPIIPIPCMAMAWAAINSGYDGLAREAMRTGWRALRDELLQGGGRSAVAGHLDLGAAAVLGHLLVADGGATEGIDLIALALAVDLRADLICGADMAGLYRGLLAALPDGPDLRIIARGQPAAPGA